MFRRAPSTVESLLSGNAVGGWPSNSRVYFNSDGDDMLVVVPRALREKAERRLRQVSRHGRLAGWVGRI